MIKIREKTIKYPIIQGGMGVGVSLGSLSGHVAKEGCLGTISMVGIGYREEDFYTDKSKANERAFLSELSKAREISGGNGLIGVNIMASTEDFEQMVDLASKSKVDFIISGAGLPLNLPSLVDENILLAPIVSSLKAFKLISKYWKDKYGKVADFVVVEGAKAGGHLGVKFKDLKSFDLSKTVSDVKSFISSLGENIPIFVAGSTYDGHDLKHYRDLGATGLQIGTRFIATEECDVHQSFKDLIIKSTSDDLTLVKSPVGLPAMAINNEFAKGLRDDGYRPKKCMNCLKTCARTNLSFCISESLIASANGDVVNGLVFAGSNIDRIDKMDRVSNIIKTIIEEYETYEDSVLI